MRNARSINVDVQLILYPCLPTGLISCITAQQFRHAGELVEYIITLKPIHKRQRQYMSSRTFCQRNGRGTIHTHVHAHHTRKHERVNVRTHARTHTRTSTPPVLMPFLNIRFQILSALTKYSYFYPSAF